MKFNFVNTLKQLLVPVAGAFLLASCNKDVEAPTPITPTPSTTTQTIADLLNDPSFSILKAAVTKANLTATLSDKTAFYTVFAPDDAAFARSGISAAVIAALPVDQVTSIVQYHVVGGQQVLLDTIGKRSPNLQLPTLLQLAPPSATLPPGLRMSIFPSKNVGAYWVNNIPLTSAGIPAANGIVYKTATIVAPPTTFLWNRISTDPNMTYFKAAIQRADSGATAAGSLVAALSNPAANLTAFIPTDAAVQQVLVALITKALVAQGVPLATAQATATALASSPTVFSNPLLYSSLTAQTVKGLVVYHLLGNRVFSVNLPVTATAFPTLLNSAIPTHPGVTIQATFGATGVTAATIKGLFNPSASNILINPTPNTGTSDQHYINGVLHEIDQVLLPQ